MKGRQAPGWRAVALALLPLAAAAESPSGAPEDWPSPVHGAALAYLVEVDQLEYAFFDGDDAVRWEASSWLGGDVYKLWLESSGAWGTAEPDTGEVEIQALLGRTLSAYADLRVGVRQEFFTAPGPDRERTSAQIDLAWLAPLWFEVAPALLVSDRGDVEAEVTVVQELLLTRRLVLQPRFEIGASAQRIRELGLEAGPTDLELGLRLRYEIVPELAPYVGVHWERALGPTAIVTRRRGTDRSALAAVVGLRFWY